MADDKKRAKSQWDRKLFLLSIVVIVFAYGFVSGSMRLFPYGWVEKAAQGLKDLEFLMARDSLDELRRKNIMPWYFKEAGQRPPARFDDVPSRDLTLLTRIEKDLSLVAVLMDGAGREVHEWDLDWFRLWPSPSHLPEASIPKSQPGTHIHGAVVLDDRKLVFNFEHLGLMCVDAEGNELWRLPYTTHHSVHLAGTGNLWVSGHNLQVDDQYRQPWRPLSYGEYTVLEVSPDGVVLNEWSVDQILMDNGYAGLLKLRATEKSAHVPDDVLHLNDVEPFPQHFKEGFFHKGDVMVSLRNINTVMVFDRETRKIRYIQTGLFDAQHDPDFIDGNRFSVFDNNRQSPSSGDPSSRILIVDARDDSVEVVFEGSQALPFFTEILGKHQWLPNGNLLVTESCEGRAFELNRDGKIVWSYRHYVDENAVGLVQQAERLDADERSMLPQPGPPPSPASP